MSILLKIIIMLGLVSALVYGCQQRDAGLIKQGQDTQRTIDQKEQDKIIADAAFELAAQTALTNAADDRTLTLKYELEATREKVQSANRAAVSARISSERLRFIAEKPSTDQCGQSSGGTKTETDSASIDAAPTYIELPRRINEDLWELQGKAESLKLDYNLLYQYVHTPGMVCTITAPN